MWALKITSNREKASLERKSKTERSVCITYVRWVKKMVKYSDISLKQARLSHQELSNYFIALHRMSKTKLKPRFCVQLYFFFGRKNNLIIALLFHLLMPSNLLDVFNLVHIFQCNLYLNEIFASFFNFRFESLFLKDILLYIIDILM